MKRQSARRRFSPHARKRLLIASLVVVGVFVAANAALWGFYHGRTYPRTRVMNERLGSVTYAQLPDKVNELNLLPDTLELTHGKQKATVSLSDLGIKKDVSRAAASANQQRSWLPVLNLFKSPELKAPVKIDEARFTVQAEQLARTLRQDAHNARLNLNGTTVTIEAGADGYELARGSLQPAVFKTLDDGKRSLAVPVQKTAPAVDAASLKPKQQDLQNKLKATIIYRYNGKSRQATPSEIATWFTPQSEIYALSVPAVQAYITQAGKDFGIRVKGTPGIAVSTVQAVNALKPLDLTLAAQTAARTFSYCVAAKNVSSAELPALRSTLQSTYGDARGWSLDGLIEFKEVSSGCDFTVWLSASDQMPSFGSICDSMWSCRVGPNVVINIARWQGASPAWNASGGALQEYRHMVINHETGHWLSFGHSHCSGAGQAAPVMQQQSIDLEGCRFNAWPVASELSALRAHLGI